MTGSRKKRGRKARYAVINGREIEGLYLTYNPDKSIRNFYYLDKNKRQVSCTADPIEAVRRFRLYQGGEIHPVQVKGIAKVVEEPSFEEIEKTVDTFQRRFKFEKSREGEYTLTPSHTISDEEIIFKFVELLKKDPYRVADISKMPQFAHMEDITPLPKSITLEELLTVFDSREDIAHNYKKDVKNFFREFKNSVEVPELRRVSYEAVGKYNDTILKQSKREEIKNPKRYVNNRFNAVKAVLYYAKKKYQYKKDIDNLLSHLEQLSYVTKFKTAKPKVIDKKEFQAMYKKADNPLTLCLLLLGLNCGVRYEDIINLKKDEINFAEKTLQRPRTKTGVIHSAILWTETIKALKAYIKDNPNDTEYVFTTKFNNQYVEKYLRTIYFNPVRAKGITHKHLRNSLSSIANRMGCNPNGIKICMGHNIGGVDNSYNERHPEATREVCEQVHKFYFGKD